jgi:hypothetical protein
MPRRRHDRVGHERLPDASSVCARDLQNQIERIMAAWIAELPVHIDYGCEVTGFAQDTGVDVELSDGKSLRAQYLVGAMDDAD